MRLAVDIVKPVVWDPTNNDQAPNLLWLSADKVWTPLLFK